MTGQWQHVALGELLTESRARVVVEPDRDYPICGVYGFGRGVLFRESIRGAEIRSAHLYEVRAGQIIYSRLKAFEGAFALVPPTADGWYVSNEFPTFDVDKQRACPDFLRLVLALPTTWRNMAERIIGVGARHERLKVPDFLGFEFDLPPFEEQRAMVSTITTMDAAITTGTAERAAAFSLLDAARDALIAPTGTWNELPKQWVMRPLGDIADVRTGITKGRITEKETHPHPFLRAANVQNGFLDLAEVKDIDVTADEAIRFALRSGDVLMVEGSGSPDRLGRGWVWDGEVERCIHQNHVFRARPDTSSVLSRFLAHLLAA